MVTSLERDVSSAEYLAALTIAVELCNSDALMVEVLCAPGSEYDRYKFKYVAGRNVKLWKEIVGTKAKTILEDLGLTGAQLEKVRNLVILIGKRMLRFVIYHEGILGLSSKYRMNFLDSSFFSAQRIVDNEKAAEQLMKDISLSIKQKYILACLYCYEKRIPDLFKEMSQEEKEDISQGINYPEVVKFWSNYLTGEVDKLRGEKSVDEYMLEKAVESRSKATIDYCLKKQSSSRNENAVVDAAQQIIGETPEAHHERELFSTGFSQGIRADYFVDVLCFLLSKSNEEQKRDILKKDIDSSQTIPPYHPRLRILEYFLDWPYQIYFLKTAKLIWEFLPEAIYADLLLHICHKINPIRHPSVHDFKTGEEKVYDYRNLLREFWIQSPDQYKRYVFSNRESRFWIGGEEVLNTGERSLIFRLLTLNSDTEEDRSNFELILGSATAEEKKSIISSKEGKDICIALMEGEQWEVIDSFLLECISSEKEAEEFKRRLSFSKEALVVCVQFIKYKWEAAESFIKWSSLNQDEVILLKKEFICSKQGRNACWYLLLYKGEEVADMLCNWCFSTKEDVRDFKKELIFSVGLTGSADLIIEDKLDLVDRFITWSELSDEDVIEFKKQLQCENGNYICENLISGGVRKRIFYEYNMLHIYDHMIQFQGGKWEQVEKFLTWCFSSEEEMRGFKKDRILKDSGKEIHFRLIESNQWAEAENFFDWLELCPEEVKKLKKETLFDHKMAFEMFWILVDSRREDKDFSDFGGRREAIELLLRWHLTDRDTALDFGDYFRQKFDRPRMSQHNWDALRDFEAALEQCVSDLDEEEKKDQESRPTLERP